MAVNKITREKLYDLFFATDIVVVKKNAASEKATPVKRKASPISNPLTPMSKKIYDATSPRSKPYVLADMKSDDEILLKSELATDDPDYIEKMENNGLGFFMENFITAYGTCPICGMKTLRKYVNSNIPVVDFVCDNTEYHLNNKTCFVFQLKISLTNNYFDLNKRTISVGSVAYGEPAHLVDGTESQKNKIVVPAYILIRMYRHKTKLQSYIIDHKNSFVLIPNYKNKTNDTYYKYTDKKDMYGKSVITWNTQMVDTVELKRVINAVNVDHEFYNEQVITNPYAKLLKLL